jgi:hypothetical protein
MAERTVRRVRSTRNLRGGGAKKKDDGGSILGAVLTPAEWLINQVSRPAYSVGSIVAGNPANALREMAAFTTLGASELIPGLDAPETTVSDALQQRGVKYPGGIGGFALRFGTDLVTDPASYVTFGTAGAVKGAVRSAGKEAIERATKEAAEQGLTGAQREAYIVAAERGARTRAKRTADRQFAVQFAPVGVTLARRGAPVASKDIVLSSSAVGRQIEKALDAVGGSRVATGTAKVFATGGDPAVENRVVDSMTQAVRQQADRTKNNKLARILGIEGKLLYRDAKAAGVSRDDAARSIGAYLLAKADAPKLGVSHAAAYANYVDNASGMLKGKKKPNYMAFSDIERAFANRISFLEGVSRGTAKKEVEAGVKTADDIIENYVPRIGRKGKDQRQANKITGYQAQSNALRSSTTQQRRVLETSDDWFKNGLIPEDDYFRLAQWRMNQSVDLIAQQTALNAVSARFGRVLDEQAVMDKVLGRQGKALEKFQRAGLVAGKAQQAQQKADEQVVQRALDIQQRGQAITDARAAGAQQVARAQGDLDVAQGVARENPLPTQAQAAREAVARSEGPTFADLQAFANEKFNARQFLVMARNELARRRQEVESGLEKASVLAPYERLVARSEQAVKDAARAPRELQDAAIAGLRTDAINLLRGERAARAAEVTKLREAVRRAQRDGNKVAIERAKGRLREAQIRKRIAEDRASRSRMNTEAAQKRVENRRRILDDRTAEVEEAAISAERTLKTPGARATPKEMAEYKKQGWQQLQFAHDSVNAIVDPKVREAVDNAFQKAWEITSDQGAYAAVRQFVNSATSRWKGLSLISVGYHMRNLQSDLMMSWMAGAKDPRSLVQAVQIIRGRPGSMVIQGQRMSYNDLLREAERNGTIRAGEVAQDAGRIAQQAERQGRGVVGPPRTPGEGSVAQASYRFGRFREDSTRLMLYIERRKAGDSAEEAAESVRNYLFDYGDVSRFVSTTRRFLLPFITWSAKALPRMVKQAVEKPRTFTRIGFATEAANQSFGPIDSNILPTGRTLSFAVPTFGVGSGPYTYNPENTLPYGVLNSFSPFGFKAAGRSAGMFLNPLVKAPIEIATNYNLYQGRTAPRRVQAPVWIRALSGAGASGGVLDLGPKQDLYTKEEVPGYSRTWDSIFRMFPPYQLAQAYPGVGVESDRISYLRSVFGVNVSPYERQRDLFYAQRFAPKA